METSRTYTPSQKERILNASGCMMHCFYDPAINSDFFVVTDSCSDRFSPFPPAVTAIARAKRDGDFPELAKALAGGNGYLDGRFASENEALRAIDRLERMSEGVDKTHRPSMNLKRKKRRNL
jgi:hypothetical protein